jgi:CRP-like cAMP-binding protein
MSARERFMAFQADHPGLHERIAQKHVAGYLGMTPEAFSRLLAQMRKTGEL